MKISESELETLTFLFILFVFNRLLFKIILYLFGKSLHAYQTRFILCTYIFSVSIWMLNGMILIPVQHKWFILLWFSRNQTYARRVMFQFTLNSYSDYKFRALFLIRYIIMKHKKIMYWYEFECGTINYGVQLHNSEDNSIFYLSIQFEIKKNIHPIRIRIFVL